MACLAANNAYSTLLVSVDASATTVTLAEGEGVRFPSPTTGDYFMVTVFNMNNVMEIMRCTHRDGDILTVVRAQEGTTARNFTAGDRVEHRFTAGMYSWIADTLAAGKQDKLTFDMYPAVGSNNPVTSNGILSAINNSKVPVGYQSFTTSGVFVVPAGVTRVMAIIVGASGGGSSGWEW